MNNSNKAALEQRKRLTAAAKSWYGDNYSPNYLNPETDTKFYLGEDYIPYDDSAEESDGGIQQAYNQIMTDKDPEPIKILSFDKQQETCNQPNTFDMGYKNGLGETAPKSLKRARINDFFPDSSNPLNRINLFAKNYATLPIAENPAEQMHEKGLHENFLSYRANRAPNENNLTYWNYADDTDRIETETPREIRGRERRHKFNRNEDFKIRLLPDNRLEKTDENDNKLIGTVWPFFTVATYGKDCVDQYHDEIEAAAKKYDIEPDLIRATMFTEMATGHWMGLNAARDWTRTSNSQRPMNINGSLWSNLGGNNYDTYVPAQNIENAALLLKKIIATQDNPNNIEAIGSLWNSLGTNHINKIGVRIGDAYRRRLWEDNHFGIFNNPYANFWNYQYGNLKKLNQIIDSAGKFLNLH